MNLRFPESEINSWASKYDYPRKETSLMHLRSEIQKAGFITKSQLKMVARWKSPRSAGHIGKNTDVYVKEVSSWSFSSEGQRSRIEALTLLDGVAWPTASVILHLFHKEQYPILDFRALWSVSADVPNQYSFPFWWQYVEFCRDVANRNALDMRILDRALWQYSKVNQVA